MVEMNKKNVNKKKAKWVCKECLPLPPCILEIEEVGRRPLFCPFSGSFASWELVDLTTRQGDRIIKTACLLPPGGVWWGGAGDERADKQKRTGV